MRDRHTCSKTTLGRRSAEIAGRTPGASAADDLASDVCDEAASILREMQSK